MVFEVENNNIIEKLGRVHYYAAVSLNPDQGEK